MATVTTTRQAYHDTPLGWMRSVWTDRGLYSLDWGVDEPIGGVEDTETGRLGDLLSEYFQTGSADFGGIQLDDSGWTEFTKSTYECCREIPCGTTLTYKQLAMKAGSVSASRAVGAAMAKNRILLVIPCHRVTGAGGDLRGFSALDGIATKRYLLDLES